MSDLTVKVGKLRKALEGVGYAFVDEAGDVSEHPVAWSFDQFVRQVPEAAAGGGVECLLDAMVDYIKNAERVKLAAARLAASGTVNGSDVVATDLVEALDSSISVPVELALELGREGLTWIPVKDGMPSRARVTEPLRATKARGDLAVRRSPDGSIFFDAPAVMKHGTFLDLVDALDKEGLTYCLVAASDRGFARGRSWLLEVDGGGSSILLDLREEGEWRAMGTVTV